MENNQSTVRFRRTKPTSNLTQITVTLSKDVADQVNKHAQAASVSRSEWIERVLKAKIGIVETVGCARGE